MEVISFINIPDIRFLWQLPCNGDKVPVARSTLPGPALVARPKCFPKLVPGNKVSGAGKFSLPQVAVK